MVRYSKRAECHPPQGKGEVTFRAYGTAANGDQRNNVYEFDLHRIAAYPPGDNLTATSAIPIPPNVPPGEYILSPMTDYVCAGASKTLRVDGPPVHIRVM